MRITLLALVLLLAALPGAAAAAPLTIRTDENAVTRIGSFRPLADPSIAAAERAFGPASSIRHAGEGCQVDWRRLRLRMFFANFGSVPRERTVCSPRVGKAQSFTARGRRFRTWQGLRVGHRSSTIRERHAGARFRDDRWWLQTAVSRFGDSSEYAVVEAGVSGGRVRGLRGWIGAAGD